MKKTLIASAVAAAALSTNAFAMDPASDLAAKIDSMPSVYGNIQLAYFYNEFDDGTTKTSSNEFADNGSTLGVKHSHAISDGLTGFFKAELEFDADDKGSSTGLSNLDEAYIGVKTDVHSVQIGSDDTVYEWIDIIDFSEAVGDSADLAGVDEGDNLQYVGTFGDFMVGATVKIDSDTTDAGALAVQYSMDELTLTGAYALGREEAGTEKGDTFGLAATMGLGDITVGGVLSMKGEDTVGTVKQENDQTLYGLMASVAMGAASFTGTYTMTTTDAAVAANEVDSTGLVLQALYNVSDNMYTYIEFATYEDESDAGLDDTDDNLAIGATYYF